MFFGTVWWWFSFRWWIWWMWRQSGSFPFHLHHQMKRRKMRLNHPHPLGQTEWILQKLLIMMFKYTKSMVILLKSTSCNQWFFTGYTKIGIPVSNPEKAGPNGENPGKNEPVVLLLLTPLWRRPPPKKSSKGSSAKFIYIKKKKERCLVKKQCHDCKYKIYVRIKWFNSLLITTEQQINMLDRYHNVQSVCIVLQNTCCCWGGYG